MGYLVYLILLFIARFRQKTFFHVLFSPDISASGGVPGQNRNKEEIVPVNNLETNQANSNKLSSNQGRHFNFFLGEGKISFLFFNATGRFEN